MTKKQIWDKLAEEAGQRGLARMVRRYNRQHGKKKASKTNAEHGARAKGRG